MKRLLLLFTLIVIGFTNCEGRKTQSQALSEDIEDFKKEIKIEEIIYVPKNYMEREVDTLLQNGYRVNIKTYSDMENSVLRTEIKDTINYQTHYRNYKFDILIEKDGKPIYQEHFNKHKINTLFKYNMVSKSDIKDKDFDKLGILKSIELNKNSTFSDTIDIEIMYAIPEIDKTSLHVLSIDSYGILKIKRLENY